MHEVITVRIKRQCGIAVYRAPEIHNVGTAVDDNFVNEPNEVNVVVCAGVIDLYA